MAENYHSAPDPVHSHEMRTRSGAVAVVWLLGFCGCAHLRDAGATEDLDHVVDLYWKAVHWQDAVAGSAFVFPDQRSEWLRSHDKQEKNLNVTSWDVQGEKVDPGNLAGTVLVKVTWYQLPSVIEQTDLAEQRWVHKDGHWLIISEKGGPLPFP